MNRLIIGAIFFVFITNCRESKKHFEYQEKVVSIALTTEGAQAKVKNPSMTWEMPAGWTKNLPKTMQFASFSLFEDNKYAKASLSLLGGNGGGLKSNISRWMRQLKMIPLSSKKMELFVENLDSVKIGEGYSGVLVDLTQILSGGLGSTESTIGAIVPVGEKTLFVKMTGDKKVLKLNKAKFIELCQSLKEKK